MELLAMSAIAKAYVLMHAILWTVLALGFVFTRRTQYARELAKEDPPIRWLALLTVLSMAALGWCSVSLP